MLASLSRMISAAKASTAVVLFVVFSSCTWAVITVDLTVLAVSSSIELLHHLTGCLLTYLIVDDTSMSNDSNSTALVSLPAPSIPRLLSPHAWEAVRDIDGARLPVIEDCVFRWMFRFYDWETIQGSVWLERFGTTRLHRVCVDGHQSVSDKHGFSVQGPAYQFALPFPIDTHYTEKKMRVATKGRRNKIFGMRCDFRWNMCASQWFQFFVNLGADDAESSEKHSRALAFQDGLEDALDLGRPVEEEQKMDLFHGRCLIRSHSKGATMWRCRHQLFLANACPFWR